MRLTRVNGSFLMVFLIQRTQNKDALAIHLKLNEIVPAIAGARVALEKHDCGLAAKPTGNWLDTIPQSDKIAASRCTKADRGITSVAPASSACFFSSTCT